MMKRSAWLALAGISGLAIMAALLAFLIFHTTQRHLHDTRGVALGVLTPGLPLRTSGSPYGANVSLDKDMANLERSLSLAQDAGMLWLRQRFPWSEIEPQRGVWRWDSYDRIVDAATAHGLKIVAVLDTSPAWARGGNVVTSPPQNNEDYGSFVAAFVSRYGGRVSHIQIWDQPNVAPNWGEWWASPAEYVALLKVAYARAKSANPAVLVLAAGLAPTVADDQWNLNDVTFLRRMYAFGARGNFDILAAKPYGFWSGPDDQRVDAGVLNFSRLILLREIMVKNGDTALPIWAVEMGWNALPAGWTGAASPWGSDSEEKQALRLHDALTRAQSEWPWLDVQIVSGLRYPAAGGDDPVRGFALLDDAWTPRPAYNALRDLARAHSVADVGFYPADTSAAIYSMGWTPVAQQDGWLVSPSASAGAGFTVTFRGTDIALYTLRQRDAGRMLVWIDGQALERLPRDGAGVSFVDPANLPNAGMQATVLADHLPDGEHILRVQVVDLFGNSQVTLGGFEVVRIISRFSLYLRLALLALGALACLAGAVLLAPRLPWAAWDALVERWPLPVQVGALAAALVVYYLAPWLPLAGLAALAFAALAFTRLDLALLLTVLTVPFYLYPRHIGGQAFSLPEVLTLLCFAAWVVRGVGRREWRWRGDVALPALFFVAVALLSLGASNDLRLSLRELRTVVIEPVLFYVVALAAFGRPNRAGRPALAWALLLAGGAAAAQALVQYGTGQVITAEGARRALGPYGSPNNLGLLLERVLPLAIVLCLWGWSQWQAQRSEGARAAAAGRALVLRLLLPAACLLVIVVALFLTYSVGAWLGAIVGLFVLAALRGRRQVATLAVALAVLAVVLLPLLRVDRVVSHLGLGGETTTTLRLDLWQSSLAMLRDHLREGVGLDGFLDAYRGVYIRPEALREPGLSHPHNLLLEWWLFLGILGVPALLWLLASFFRRAWRSLRSLAPAQTLLVQGAMAGMAAALTHGMVDRFYFGAPDLAYVFFALLALAPHAVADAEKSP